MITLTITDEQLQASFDQSLVDILSPGNSSSPVKRVLDDMLGYSGLMKGEIGKQIQEFVTNSLGMPSFQAKLGQAIADEMARRAVSAMEKK